MLKNYLGRAKQKVLFLLSNRFHRKPSLIFQKRIFCVSLVFIGKPCTKYPKKQFVPGSAIFSQGIAQKWPLRGAYATSDGLDIYKWRIAFVLWQETKMLLLIHFSDFIFLATSFDSCFSYFLKKNDRKFGFLFSFVFNDNGSLKLPSKMQTELIELKGNSILKVEFNELFPFPCGSKIIGLWRSYIITQTFFPKDMFVYLELVYTDAKSHSLPWNNQNAVANVRFQHELFDVIATNIFPYGTYWFGRVVCHIKITNVYFAYI